MLGASDDHRRLQVTQRHHVITRLGYLGDVDDVVVQAQFVERLVGGVALNAGRLGVDGDGNLRKGSSTRKWTNSQGELVASANLLLRVGQRFEHYT